MGSPVAPGEPVNCSVSGSFHDWMSRAGGSVAITTYQAGRIALLGFANGRVTPVLREFDTPMGLAVANDSLALATRSEITIFANAPALAAHDPPGAPAGHDALYLPRVTYHTGDLRVHDVAFAGQDLWFVNTLFSCLCTASRDFSFQPRWNPPFITRLAPEDRCHLNGLALEGGVPRFATSVGASDAPEGWRPGKADGGVLLELESGDAVLTGLSMPHSPRLHRGKLWVLNSGTGEVCEVDPVARRYTPVVQLPGFLRGLGFAGDFALVGMCQIRQSNLFGGLRVQAQFQRLLCGVAVVDLRDGKHVATFEFTSGIHEVFGVEFIAGVSRPTILPAGSPDARRAITSPAVACWYAKDR